MTPTQREAALRLADCLAVHSAPNIRDAAALLRELAQEQQGEPVFSTCPMCAFQFADMALHDAHMQIAELKQQRTPLTFTQLCSLMPPDFQWGDPCNPALARHILEAAHGITGEKT
jgi:hypothetical protein